MKNIKFLCAETARKHFQRHAVCFSSKRKQKEEDELKREETGNKVMLFVWVMYLCTHTDWSTVETSSGRWRRWSWGRLFWGPGWSETSGSRSDLQKHNITTIKGKCEELHEVRFSCSVSFNTNLVPENLHTLPTQYFLKEATQVHHEFDSYDYFPFQIQFSKKLNEAVGENASTHWPEVQKQFQLIKQL